MASTIERVGTYSQRSSLVGQMLAIQKRLTDTQTQVNTEQKSQDYTGLSADAFRLVSMENESSRVSQFMKTNTVISSRLKVASTSVEAVDKTVRDFRSQLSLFSQVDLTKPLTDEETTKLKDLQNRAFEALKSTEYYLNNQHDGSYLFAGGRTDTPPVDIPYNTLEEFQNVFNGKTVTYPQSRAANLADAKVAGTMTVAPGALATDPGTITAAAGSFIDATKTETGVGGDLTFTAANNTVASPQFVGTTIAAGDVIRVDMGATGPLPVDATGNYGGNERFYTVKAVDATTGTLTLESSPPVTNEAVAGAWTISVPKVMPGQVSVSGAGANDQTYTVSDISADGTTLYITPPPGATTTTAVTVAPHVYYQGDELSTQQRIDDDRSITTGINAKNPAFEKALRAMAIIAQGDLQSNPGRVQQALNLLGDSVDHSPQNTSELSGDLTDVAQVIGLNQATVKRTSTEQQSYLTFLQNRSGDIETVDKTEALVRLSDDAQALQASFAAFSRITSLSLVSYL